ncbi:tetratricopeptide repeat protein [bacterium BMS3Abin04]|nr:tetratricopeptide repeat protein [bacterium BMS3Abin04]
MSLKKIILIIFVISGQVCSNPLFHQKIAQGIPYLYNLELKKASDIFNEAAKISPDDPRSYYYIAQIHLWSFLGSKEEHEYKQFFKFSDIAKNKIESIEKIDGKDYLADFWKGNIYTQRALAYSSKDKMLDAFWAAKKAIGYLEDVIDEKPDFYDAYLGIGIFDYALTYVPGIFKFALTLTGLDADKLQGFNNVRLAKQKGSLFKTEATFHLARMYTDYLAEYDSSAILLNSLIKKFPRNSLFIYQYAITLIYQRKLDLAEKELYKVINLNNKNFSQTNSFSYFLLGDVQLRKNNFNEAIENYIKFLTTTKAVDYTGIAGLRVALCYKFLNNEKLYEKYLLLARNGNKDIPEDSYAKEYSEILFEYDLNKNQLTVIQAGNYLLAGEYKDVAKILNPVLHRIKQPDWKGKVLIYLAESNIELGNYNSAFNFASRAISVNYNFDKWILPYALYLKAKAYWLTGNDKEAVKYLLKAENENDYYKKEYLQSLINNLKQKLNLPE